MWCCISIWCPFTMGPTLEGTRVPLGSMTLSESSYSLLPSHPHSLSLLYSEVITVSVFRRKIFSTNAEAIISSLFSPCTSHILSFSLSFLFFALIFHSLTDLGAWGWKVEDVGCLISSRIGWLILTFPQPDHFPSPEICANVSSVLWILSSCVYFSMVVWPEWTQRSMEK